MGIEPAQSSQGERKTHRTSEKSGVDRRHLKLFKVQGSIAASARRFTPA
jgi:hypothetical protein